MLDKIIITIAKIISVITSPIIMPTYGMLIALWGRIWYLLRLPHEFKCFYYRLQ